MTRASRATAWARLCPVDQSCAADGMCYPRGGLAAARHRDYARHGRRQRHRRRHGAARAAAPATRQPTDEPVHAGAGLHQQRVHRVALPAGVKLPQRRRAAPVSCVTTHVMGLGLASAGQASQRVWPVRRSRQRRSIRPLVRVPPGFMASWRGRWHQHRRRNGWRHRRWNGRRHRRRHLGGGTHGGGTGGGNTGGARRLWWHPAAARARLWRRLRCAGPTAASSASLVPTAVSSICPTAASSVGPCVPSQCTEIVCNDSADNDGNGVADLWATRRATWCAPTATRAPSASGASAATRAPAQIFELQLAAWAFVTRRWAMLTAGLRPPVQRRRVVRRQITSATPDGSCNPNTGPVNSMFTPTNFDPSMIAIAPGARAWAAQPPSTPRAMAPSAAAGAGPRRPSRSSTRPPARRSPSARLRRARRLDLPRDRRQAAHRGRVERSAAPSTSRRSGPGRRSSSRAATRTVARRTAVTAARAPTRRRAVAAPVAPMARAATAAAAAPVAASAARGARRNGTAIPDLIGGLRGRPRRQRRRPRRRGWWRDPDRVVARHRLLRRLGDHANGVGGRGGRGAGTGGTGSNGGGGAAWAAPFSLRRRVRPQLAHGGQRRRRRRGLRAGCRSATSTSTAPAKSHPSSYGAPAVRAASSTATAATVARVARSSARRATATRLAVQRHQQQLVSTRRVAVAAVARLGGARDHHHRRHVRHPARGTCGAEPVAVEQRRGATVTTERVPLLASLVVGQVPIEHQPDFAQMLATVKEARAKRPTDSEGAAAIKQDRSTRPSPEIRGGDWYLARRVELPREEVRADVPRRGCPVRRAARAAAGEGGQLSYSLVLNAQTRDRGQVVHQLHPAPDVTVGVGARREGTRTWRWSRTARRSCTASCRTRRACRSSTSATTAWARSRR